MFEFDSKRGCFVSGVNVKGLMAKNTHIIRKWIKKNKKSELCLPSDVHHTHTTVSEALWEGRINTLLKCKEVNRMS